MPSTSYQRWRTTRAGALDEIEQAHAALGGTGPGRRYATQQVNRAYAVLLASQFQGFCRDLHDECIDHLITVLAPPTALEPLMRDAQRHGRQLDQRNAQPSSLAADFSRLGIDFWPQVQGHHPRNRTRKVTLELVNRWRNAVAHQDFDPARLGGTTTLRLAEVRKWRGVCQRLARTFDAVMHQHLHTLTGQPPW